MSKPVRESAGSSALRRSEAARYLIASIASLAVGALVYHAQAPHLDIVKVELGGSAQTWPLPAGTHAAVHWDFVLILGYGLALVFALQLAGRVFWSRRAQKIASAAKGLAYTAVAADLTENGLLLRANSAHTRVLDYATAASVVKFSCLAPAAIVAVVALLVTASRLWTNRRSRLKRWAPIGTYPTIPLTADDPWTPNSAQTSDLDPDDRRERWKRGYLVPGIDAKSLAERKGETLGICLSGGGVRSASVALGALQALRPQLKRARYLVSVSGGGYTAGALQLALTDAGDERREPGETFEHTADDAFMPGSVEEDWFRRHADYLADSPATMLVALGVVARVLLLSLAFLFGPAIVLGIAIGRAYKEVPLAKWRPRTLHPWAPHVVYPALRTGTWFALGFLAVLALAVYFVALIVRTDLVDGVRTVAKGITLVAVVVAVIAVGLPSIVYGAAWVLSKAASGRAVIGGSVGTVLVSYAVTIASIGRNKKVKDEAGGFLKRGGSAVGAAPAGALQLVLVVVILLVLAAGWLLLFGGMAAVADRHDAGMTEVFGFAALLLFGLVFDQTLLSLHPFYRRQLAAAFAMRRVSKLGRPTFAQSYGFTEMTTLSKFGERPTRVGKGNDAVFSFPEVIFAGTANLTGESRAPLNGVPYTFSASWVGGPDIGYLHTADLEERLDDLNATKVLHDLTVQAAVAISGAAFASAMGRSDRWYGTLLAVTGVRLGSWLPNPVFIEEWNHGRGNDLWTMPGIPRLRRLPYLVREVLGIHQFSDRLLQVTDGGHYENLGLVELLRRRCTEIYCIDASGDSPPTAGTLEQALTIAYAELGVTIELHDEMWNLVPGSGTALEPKSALTTLNARLAKQAVVTATIHYPDESGLEGAKQDGTLVFAKTLLTQAMDYPVLSYAARNSIFPRDSTGDQFFDDGKFCAYRALGYELGTLAGSRMESS